MKTAAETARAAAAAYFAEPRHVHTDRLRLEAIIEAAVGEALRDREAELLAGAAGAEVTPGEVEAMVALLESVEPGRPTPVRRALREIRRLWLILGQDFAPDSPAYRAVFTAGWRACREAAAREMEGEVEGLHALESPYAGGVLRALLAARLRALEPPDPGGP